MRLIQKDFRENMTRESKQYRSISDITFCQTWLLGFKKISCSTQLSIKFIKLINVKMPTIVGILTFMSMINTTCESLKARKVLIFQHFSFCEQLKFHAQLS